MPEHNNHYDNPIGAFQPVTSPDQLTPTWHRYFENLQLIQTWRHHELLMLIRQHVDISTVTHHWLIQFQEDLDLQV